MVDDTGSDLLVKCNQCYQKFIFVVNVRNQSVCVHWRVYVAATPWFWLAG